MEKHVVIGAKGGAGYGVTEALKAAQLPFATLQRGAAPAGTTGLQGDILNLSGLKKGLEGATHVYVCAGLPYSYKVWQTQWPLAMQNIIEAASANNTKVIFLDNMYMYGPAPLPVPFDENTPQRAFTRKGATRKQIAQQLLEAAQNGTVQAVIGRAADFYGPAATNSHFYFSFLERMLLGKGPQTLMGKGVPHTFAYTLDMGKAMLALAQDPTNNGEVFHLPVSGDITVEEMVALCNQVLNTSHKPAYMPDWLIPVVGLFSPTFSEIKEMLYQFRQPYHMSWDKFRQRYPQVQATPYLEGIQGMVNYFRQKAG